MAAVQTGINQSEATTKLVEQLVSKLNHIDSLVNSNETGIIRENAKMKDEITYLISTVKNQEDRIVEMESEVQVPTMYIQGVSIEILHVFLGFADHQEPDE